ncbi:zinc-dependent alcohol dehydrogenase family protein [Sphingobium sp. YR768]|jgi:NADPH:quinone reductase-like Zn-dependent oxidoreductase|uniref:zinc-dependent alcohol dehydrogenase family protein n=1 Tax=Sphingobium sp. YR768 TaxID=1884365 RepID=UPI0008CED3D9|nr:NAD(P)-dependent alcohol dehydrogenase [Sphingobium sp. YR768]SES15670.1 NADPH:quinone reductase [Sphingobium sp. YR768]
MKGTDVKAIRTITRDGIDGLEMRDLADPTPGDREVVIRIKAASINYRDLLLVNGHYPGCFEGEMTPLTDGAGEVVAVGAAVSRITVGDRVSVNNITRWVAGPLTPTVMVNQPGIFSDGMLASMIAVEEDGVVILPGSLSFEEAAALPCAGVTAWSALTDGGRPLRAGQTVLLLGTGGVSLLGLQFAKAMGLRVIATTSSHDKANRLKAFGADHVVNYKDTPDWQEAVRALTDGKGVERVLEVGGPGTIERSIASLAYGGHVSLIGFVGGMEGALNPLSLLTSGVSLQPVGIGSRTQFEELLQLIDANGVRPAIDRVFAFNEFKDAFAHVASGSHFGKVVIAVD